MIALEIPVDKIPYVRTIEGRRFKNGKWEFPEAAAKTLQKLGFLPSDYQVEEKQVVQYEMSPFLRGYQKNICNKALNEEGYGIFAEMGAGKTACMLEIIKHIGGKALVLCPLSVIKTAWIDDCHKFYPELKIINCHASSKAERIKKLNIEADIYVMNYESFKILKNEILKKNFQCMVVDESSVMKNMKSQITVDILSMVDAIPRRYVLSGTPTPNHNSEIFPQMKFVNRELFGNNYLGFLARYFHQNMENPHIWYQTQEDKDRFFSRLSESSVFLKKEDCVDLPPKVFTVKRYSLTKTERALYDNILQDIKDKMQEWSKFEFTAKLMKLRQVVSGFIIGKDGSVKDINSNVSPLTSLTNKEKLLQESLEEIGDKPVIIWCQFIHEVEILAEKFNGVALTSKTKNRDDVIRDFKNNKIKRLFTHPKLLGKGLTFTNCTYNIYYSLSFSYEEFRQSQDRIHRIGQENKCTYIILQAENTIDEKIYSCLQRKGNAVDELYLEMGLKNT